VTIALAFPASPHGTVPGPQPSDHRQ
jgi:hypothetical protein